MYHDTERGIRMKILFNMQLNGAWTYVNKELHIKLALLYTKTFSVG